MRTLPILARLALLAAVAGCGAAPLTCELPEIAANLAGAGATDCGTVTLGSDPAAADACVVAGFQAGTAYFAVYELQGIDSAVSIATASDGTTTWFLSRDSDPSGGSNTGAVVSQIVCGTPAVTAGEAGHDVLVCDVAECGCDMDECGEAGSCCSAD